MHTTGARPETMPREECLRLLATTGIGRIIYTRHALPAVELVTFALESGDIVARTVLESLVAAVRESVVAFEADRVDPHDRSGWAVTVIGTARCSSSPGGYEHVIRIRQEIVTGLHFAVPATPRFAA
jgi:hypothetical protein